MTGTNRRTDGKRGEYQVKTMLDLEEFINTRSQLPSHCYYPFKEDSNKLLWVFAPTSLKPQNFNNKVRLLLAISCCASPK